MSYKEFIASERYTKMIAEGKPQTKAIYENKVLSLASWAMTKKKMKNSDLSIDQKMSALVDLVAMGAFLNQKEIAKLKKSLGADIKRFAKKR